MTALRKSPVALSTDAAPFVIRSERASDVVAREALLDACFGANRHMRTCQRLRDGRAPAEGLALSVVRQGRLAGTVRLWHVCAGGVPALVLGPLAVDPSCRKLGAGRALMNSQSPGRADMARYFCWATRLIMPASAFRRSRPANCRCPARSNATACSVSNCARARSTAPPG